MAAAARACPVTRLGRQAAGTGPGRVSRPATFPIAAPSVTVDSPSRPCQRPRMRSVSLPVQNP
jgi:hypothetical protein